MSADTAFDTFEAWLGEITARLTPARRIALARKLGQLLRQANATRVAANLTPDGAPMTPRKPRPERKTRKGRPRLRDRQRSARMFRRIELARNMRVQPTAEGTTLTFAPRIAHTAAVHHFGLEDTVDPRKPGAPTIRYPERPLLGVRDEDRAAIMDQVMAWLGKRDA